MAVIELIVGALLGALLSIVLPRVYHAYKIALVEKQQSQRACMLESGAVYKWLVQYYEDAGCSEDLYNCKIGGYEIKIPFITKSAWQFRVSNPDQIGLVQYAETEKKDFPVNTRLLQERAQIGQKLFDDPTLYLDRLEDVDGKLKLHVKACSYFEMATSLGELENETMEAITMRSNTTPIRDSVFCSLNTICKLKRKPFSIGCVCVIALQINSSWKLIIQTRSHATITYGGTKTGIPTFGLSPLIGAKETQEILTYNFVREYCEELFNYDDLIEHLTQKRTDPFWFYQLPEAKLLEESLDKGFGALEFNGFGFDGLNGTATISLLLRIVDEEFAQNLKETISANWEIANYTLTEEPIKFVDYESPELEQWLRNKKGDYPLNASDLFLIL